MTTKESIKDYILSLDAQDYAKLKRRWEADLSISIEEEYGSQTDLAEEMVHDPCWLTWLEEVGGTPEEYVWQ